MTTHLFRFSKPRTTTFRRTEPAVLPLRLVTGAVRSFRAPLLHSITCERGRVWVTCTDDRADHMLEAGEIYIPQSHGLVVIEALSPAVIRVDQG